MNGSVARRLLKDLSQKGVIRQVGDHNQHITIYSGAQVGKAEPKEAAPAGEGKKQQAKKEAPPKKGKEVKKEDEKE